jgi:5-methylcytosine-specific restriction enzyme subunit McrC
VRTPTPPTSIEIGEYDRRRLLVEAPTDADLRLAERLLTDEIEGRLGVRWLATREVELTTSSWVGVVRFSNLEVKIVPKIVGGALQVLRMLEYGAGVKMLRYLPVDRPLPGKGTNLFDLICLLLSKEAEGLIRDGLLRLYRETDETLRVLRGRLRFRDQYMRRFGRLDELECRFDEYDSDNPENQLVAAALVRARPRVEDGEIQSSISRLANVFEEACTAHTFDADWYETRIGYNRQNGRYRPAHELAKLVLQGHALNDMYDTSGATVSAFLIDMNRVFERFVSRLVKEALATTSLHVLEQRRIQATIRNDRTGRSYSTIVPDLVIHDTALDGRSVPIDVKYKTYDLRKLSTSDIYQSFLYAYALAEESADRRAGILYAASSTADGPRLSIRPPKGAVGARIAAAPIDVPRALEAVIGLGSRAAFLGEIRSLVTDLTGLEAIQLTRVGRVA